MASMVLPPGHELVAYARQMIVQTEKDIEVSRAENEALAKKCGQLEAQLLRDEERKKGAIQRRAMRKLVSTSTTKTKGMNQSRVGAGRGGRADAEEETRLLEARAEEAEMNIAELEESLDVLTGLLEVDSKCGEETMHQSMLARWGLSSHTSPLDRNRYQTPPKTVNREEVEGKDATHDVKHVKLESDLKAAYKTIQSLQKIVQRNEVLLSEATKATKSTSKSLSMASSDERSSHSAETFFDSDTAFDASDGNGDSTDFTFFPVQSTRRKLSMSNSPESITSSQSPLPRGGGSGESPEPEPNHLSPPPASKAGGGTVLAASKKVPSEKKVRRKSVQGQSKREVLMQLGKGLSQARRRESAAPSPTFSRSGSVSGAVISPVRRRSTNSIGSPSHSVERRWR